jgi:hypothetical protein
MVVIEIAGVVEKDIGGSAECLLDLCEQVLDFIFCGDVCFDGQDFRVFVDSIYLVRNILEELGTTASDDNSLRSGSSPDFSCCLFVVNRVFQVEEVDKLTAPMPWPPPVIMIIFPF